jgi:hypothetical protein
MDMQQIKRALTGAAVTGAVAAGAYVIGKPLLNRALRPWIERAYRGADLSGLGALSPGDVLLKYGDASVTSVLIVTIQNGWHILKPTFFVHAALVAGPEDDLHALEMSGEGLFYNSLSTTNRRYAYEVFRPKADRFAGEAAALARPLAELAEKDKDHVIPYNYEEMALSLTSFEDLVTQPDFEAQYKRLCTPGVARDLASKRKFYCSQFVVWLYQGAKYRTSPDEPLWSTSEHVSPAIMAWQMKRKHPDRWQHVGHLPADTR